MRRILVTGASGFVGAHLRGVLRDAFPGVELTAATRGEPTQGWDRIVLLDVLDPASCAAAVGAVRPDAVLHLAAQADVALSFRDPAVTWRANLLGTLALAEAVRAEAPDAVLVHASSAEIYGLAFQAGLPLAEDAPLRPANPYAASKAAADLALGEMALRGLRAIRLRPVNHTGPGQSERFVVAAFARQVALIAAGRQAPVIRTGALDRWRDFLDVTDVCAGYVAALRAAPTLPSGAVFNLATGTPRHIGTILTDLIRLAGIAAGIEADATRLRPTDVASNACDPGAALKTLGWQASVPWERTLAAVLADWRLRIV